MQRVQDQSADRSLKSINTRLAKTNTAIAGLQSTMTSDLSTDLGNVVNDLGTNGALSGAAHNLSEICDGIAAEQFLCAPGDDPVDTHETLARPASQLHQASPRSPGSSGHVPRLSGHPSPHADQPAPAHPGARRRAHITLTVSAAATMPAPAGSPATRAGGARGSKHGWMLSRSFRAIITIAIPRRPVRFSHD